MKTNVPPVVALSEVHAGYSASHTGKQFRLGPIDIKMFAGQAVGIAGRNGSGKSTLIALLFGALSPLSGQVRVFELDPTTHAKKVAGRIGVVSGHQPRLFPTMTLEQNTEVLRLGRRSAGRYGDNDAWVQSAIEHFEVAELFGKPISSLSFGQRMRAETFGAILHQPSLLLLDEPTVGLDFHTRQLILTFAKEFVETGGSVVIVSHNHEDFDGLCDTILIMEAGRQIGAHSSEQISDSMKGLKRLEITCHDQAALEQLSTIPLLKKEGEKFTALVDADMLRTEAFQRLLSGTSQSIEVRLSNPTVSHSVADLLLGSV